MQQDTPENRAAAESFLSPLNKAAKPVSVGLFGGAIVPEKGSFPMKLVLRAMLKPMPQGDWRDWDAIRAWAEDLRERLSR